MPGRSIIENHARRADIESAILSGVQGKLIARQFGVSESAVSRHKSGAMARAAESNDAQSDAGSADTLIRLVDLAESTRRARQIADRTGSPAVKAAAQRAELAVLDRLSSKLGVTDLSVLAYSAMAQDMYAVIKSVVQDHPDFRDDVLARMGKRTSLKQLADDLSEKKR